MTRTAAGTAPRVVVQPLLDLELPTTDEEFTVLSDRNPYAHTKAAPLFEILQKVQHGEHRAYANIAAFLRAAYELNGDIDAAIAQAIAGAHTLLDHPQIVALTPPEFHPKLWPEDLRARTPATMDELLAQTFQRGSTPREQLQAFEAQRILALALDQFLIQHSIAAPDKHRAQFNATRALLEDRLLIPERTEEIDLYTNHDPENENRCTAARFDTHPQWEEDRRKVTRVRVRYFRDLKGYPRRVLVAMRVKDALGILLVMRRDHLAFPDSVKDLHGMRFVCFSHEDRRACREALRVRFPRISVMAGDWVDQYSQTAVRSLNRFSSSYFRAQKFACELTAGSGRWEVQLMHIHDYANLWYSLGKENWYQYRLRQLFSLFFPQCFPTALYGISWKRRGTAHRRFQEWVREKTPHAWPET